MIVGISGKIGSGKDQLGQYLVDQIGSGSIALAFADPIKRIACDYMGVDPDIAWGTQEQKQETLTDWLWSDIPRHLPNWSDDKEDRMTVRELLQWIGTELFRRHMASDFWVRATLNRIRNEFACFNHHIITDVRFPNEARAIKEVGGIVVRVWRTKSAIDNHLSETAFDSDDEYQERRINLPMEEYWTTNALGESPFDIVVNNVGTLDQLFRSASGISRFYVDSLVT